MLDFRNIECHSIFFRLRNIKLKNSKNQFDFQIEFQFLKIEAMHGDFFNKSTHALGLYTLRINCCKLCKSLSSQLNPFFSHKFSAIMIKYELLTKCTKFVTILQILNENQVSQFSMKFSQSKLNFVCINAYIKQVCP